MPKTPRPGTVRAASIISDVTFGDSSDPASPRSAAVPLVLSVLWILVATGSLVWPRLPVNAGPGGSGVQSSVSLGFAAIVAALLVLLPTAVLVGVQLLAQFSWRTARMVVSSRDLAVIVLLTAVAGIFLPMGVALNPSPWGTRCAAVGFVTALCLMTEGIRRASERATPAWLIEKTTRRVQVLARRSGSAPALNAEARFLAELVGQGQLPVRQHRTAAATWAFTVVVLRTRQAAVEDTVLMINSVIAEVEAARRSDNADVVAALLAVALCLDGDQAVVDAVDGALQVLAVRERTDDAVRSTTCIDALAWYTEQQLLRHLDDRQLEALTEPDSSPRLVTRRARVARFFADPVVVPPPARLSEPGNDFPPAAPSVLLGSINVDKSLDQIELSNAIRMIAPQSRASSGGAGVTHAWDAFDLTRDRIRELSAILAAPTPDAFGWPGGWQGSSAFAEDVRRIAAIAEHLYMHWRLPPDAAEEALEQIALRAIRESGPEMTMPPDRTGWRRSHAHEPGSPLAAVVTSLAQLGSAAFTAGFDHRALVTGRRMLGVTAEAAASGNTTLTTACADALHAFFTTLRDTSRRGGIAGTHRCDLIIAGLIADLDPLITVVAQFPKSTEAVREVIEGMPWLSEGNPYPLASAAVGAHLIAAGWTVNDSRRLRYSDQHPPQPPALGEQYVADMYEQLRLHLRLDDPTLPLTYAFVLWAQTVIQVRAGDEQAAGRLGQRLRDLLARHDEEIDDDVDLAELGTAERLRILIERRRTDRDEAPRWRAMHPHVRALVDTALRWSGATDSAAETGHPCRRTRLRATVRKFLSSPHFTEATYHGLANTENEYLVVVEEVDGSRRLLRDFDAAARSAFAWGGGSTGPWNLAEALVKDILGDQARCPWCRGASVFAAGQARCLTCDNSGLHPVLFRIIERLLTNAIYDIEELAEPLIPEASWSIRRSALLVTAAEIHRPIQNGAPIPHTR